MKKTLSLIRLSFILVFTTIMNVSDAYSQVLNLYAGGACISPTSNCTASSTKILGAFIGLAGGTPITGANVSSLPDNTSVYVFLNVEKTGLKYDLYVELKLTNLSTGTTTFIQTTTPGAILTANYRLNYPITGYVTGGKVNSVYKLTNIIASWDNTDDSIVTCNQTNYSACNGAIPEIIAVGPSVAPSSITGISTICNGSSTVLTATGGTLSSTGSYQWGNGPAVGSNIITGQTGATITVTPTGTTTYWVRVIDVAPVNNISSGISTIITVVYPSTAPTTITGNTTICAGTSSTLAASGGSLSAAGSYQWGTGSTVGSNIIAGQTAASITVSPTLETTYWVRRVDTVCINTTAALTQTVSVISSVGGTLSANQNICAGISVSDIVLTGNVGNVVKWQKSTDASFATSTDITNTSTTLSSSAIGSLNVTTYFRAVVANGSCSNALSTASGIIVAPATVGGTISGSNRVCNGTNSITLILGGKIGSILKWQSSPVIDFSSNVTDIANTTQGLTVTNSTTTTYYRAVVQNGTCAVVNSSTGTITVDPITVGGTITGSKNYCAGINNQSVLTLTANTGSVMKWQSSLTSDFSGSVTDIVSNSVTLVVTNINATTYYRAVVQSGACSSAYSSTGTITIDPVSVGGTVSGGTVACPGSNSTTLVLTGNRGSIQWQSSTNNTTFTAIAGATASTYTATNLSATTYFRASSLNGVCSAANSTVGTVSIDPVTVAGTISGNARVCAGSNSSTLTLTGYNASLQWQSSSDNTNFAPISGATSATYTATNLSSTTYYRVVVQNGTCTPVNSGVATITVDSISVGGTVSGSNSVCPESNSTTLTLTGNNGAIQWQSSANNIDFNDIVGASSSTYVAANLTATTYYRTTVKNGSCNAVFSSVGTLTVISPPSSGFISGGTTVCSGTNSTTLTLAGNTGSSIQWQVSSDNTTFTNISGATASTYTATNLSAVRYYKALVSNVCSAVTSSSVSVNVDAPSVGGTVAGSTRYCLSNNLTTALTLSGNVGTVIKWQSSSTRYFSANVQDIANATTSLSVSNLTATTYYRAVIQNGTCNPINSGTATITVDGLSVGGTVSGSTVACPGSNSTALVLSGNSGSIQWQSSTNNTTFTAIAGATASTYTATNLSATTYFRASSISGVCSSANSTVGTVSIDPVTVAGTISGNARVCAGSNSSTMTLTGYNANLQWQSSSDNTNFASISGATSASYTATNLSSTTYYRVVVQNGTCTPVNSGVATITVDSISVGGTVSGSNSVCPESNSTTLTLSGNNGAIQWQSSANNSDFTDIVGASSSTYVAANLTATTYYRTTVKNGSCNAVFSSVGTLTVISPPSSGFISGGSTVCSGTNSTTLTLAGNTGSAIQWQVSSDNTTFTNISGATASTYTATNLTAVKYYRALVSNACTAVASPSVSVNVDAPSLGGTVAGSTRYCLSNNLTTALTLSGNVGAVIKWQSSSSRFFTANVQDIANTTTSLSVSNLTATTYFRAVVKNGTCNPINSGVATITIDALSVGGTISGATSVCPNVNSTTLTLSGQLGSIVKWQSSTAVDFSASVTDIANSTSSLVATNLSVKTYYRAIIANGTCSSAISATAKIDIKPLLGSIGEISGLTTVCGLTSATYTIAPVANATDYIWTFPSGLSVYSSAGNSVVVNIDELFRDGVITVKATNGCQMSIIKTISISKKPKLSTINGPISTCGITSGTYTANTLTGVTYNWTVPGGMTITAGQGTPTIQVSYDPNYNTGNIGVTATNSCGVSDVLEYSVNAIQMPTLITGLAQIGSATSGTYTTPVVSGMGYVWTIPAGVSIGSGQGTNAVSLNFASSFTSGTITVAMISSCGTSTPRTFDINRSQPIIVIYGPESLCGIAQITYDTAGTLIDYNTLFATYTVPAVSDALQYVWTVPQGATIVSGQGTNNIVMSFDNATFVNGNVTVTTITQYGTGATRSLAVKRVVGTISGTTNVCDLTTATYSVPNTIGTNFTWTLPSWMSVVSGQGTNSISVSIGTPFASDNVRVNFVSNCTTNEAFNLNVGCFKSTNIKDNQCGTTLLNLDSTIYPNPVLGAQAYKYKVTNGTNVRIYEPIAPLFNLTQLPGGVTYNTTYTVQIAVKLNGAWGGFGSPCTITTPSPITKVKAANCGTTLAAINTSVYADALSGVQGYRFEVTDPSNYVRTYDATTNLFNLTQLVGGVAYNTAYSIRVAANANGVWGAYGASCSVTTPGVAATKVTASQCGTTLLALNTSVYYVAVYAAQAYRFEVTNGTTVVTYDLTNTANLFNLTQLAGGAAYATTYSIRVASNVNGAWSAYGTTCTIATPAAITKVKALYCGTTLAAINTTIYADALIGVQGYRFEVSDGTTARTYDAVSNLFNLTQLTGGAAFSTTYSIRVAVNVNGVWGAYGAVCNVSTPVQPSARLMSGPIVSDSDASVFTVKGYPNPFTDKFNLELTSDSKGNVEIDIFDMLGKLITKNIVEAENVNNTTLGDELSSGVYTVIVNQGNGVKILRIVKR